MRTNVVAQSNSFVRKMSEGETGKKWHKNPIWKSETHKIHSFKDQQFDEYIIHIHREYCYIYNSYNTVLCACVLSISAIAL